MQQNEIKPIYLTLHKTQLKVDKDLCITPETLCLLEENIGPTLHHVSLETKFLNKTSKVQEVKSRINK